MPQKIPNADAPFDIVWDDIGVAHVYAKTVADAYRGMGYAAGSERLWQIHLSSAYANGEAAALLGERFVAQDALQRACNVDGRQTGLPPSDGDWIVDAYLDGLNAVVDGLADVPPEFRHAGAEPRHFTRADIAARYRFTSWFQHKSWTEKMMLGRLMAEHGVDWFRRHVLHFSADDERIVEELAPALRNLDMSPLRLAYPDAPISALSGSNNWAVTGQLSASNSPMLATDPHQPHSIPNTFFYVHLSVGDWDAFGSAFPGVPYFMMGYTRELAFGLTTGFVDCYDIYIEDIRDGQYRAPDGMRPLTTRTESIAVKGGSTRDVSILSTPHGPLLGPLTNQLGLSTQDASQFGAALYWSLADVPTSAGALAQLPLATSAAEFGEKLFEHDVSPLVNNIICVDRQNHLRRFIATTLPVRRGVTGSVPLPGWEATYDFRRSRANELVVEIDPACGYSLTANNDTMEDRGAFYIHNFPTASARADRIRQHLDAGSTFSIDDFTRMQLDLTDLRARELLPDLIDILATSDDADLVAATTLLRAWNHEARTDAAAPCIYYPFLDRVWYRRFMRGVLKNDLLKAIPTGAPGLNRFDIATFLADGSPWADHKPALVTEIQKTMKTVWRDVEKSLGDNPDTWRWGDLQQIRFEHRLAKQPTWSHLHVGPDPLGGSGTTLGMAVHMGPGPGNPDSEEIPCRVYHGPAYRLVVDLADPDHAQFVIAGGNGGRPDSPFATNQYSKWLRGEYYRLSLVRGELSPVEVLQFE